MQGLSKGATEVIKSIVGKGKPDFGKAKAALGSKARQGNATNKELKALKELRSMDAKASRSARIKSSQTQRSKKPVTLAGMKGEEKGKKISFFDEKTGEVFEMSKAKYDSMTPRQRTQQLRNMQARSELGEDLSDKAMAKQRKKLAAAKDSRKKGYGGKMTKKNAGGAAAAAMEYKEKQRARRVQASKDLGSKTLNKGGKAGSRPRGVGCATRGYGKAMK